MKVNLLRLARRNWTARGVSHAVNRANQRKYARAVTFLGDKWLFARPVTKLNAERYV